jgi:DNA-binding PadR family transcriptional regulator
MDPVTSLVLDGMLEGLVLHAVERAPTHGYGILKDLENALGEAPNKNKVYRLLRDLEEEDLVVSEEVEEGSRTRQVYSITERGLDRLDDYRNLPGPFKEQLAGLFGIGETPTDPDRASSTPDAWVEDVLAQIPDNPAIQAPGPEITLDRAPGKRTWSIRVENHEPGQYEDADACPLTFLYFAAQQLAFGPGR